MSENCMPPIFKVLPSVFRFKWHFYTNIHIRIWRPWPSPVCILFHILFQSMAQREALPWTERWWDKEHPPESSRAMLLAPYHLLWKRLQKREIGGTEWTRKSMTFRVVSRQGLKEIHSFASLWCLTSSDESKPWDLHLVFQSKCT